MAISVMETQLYPEMLEQRVSHTRPVNSSGSAFPPSITPRIEPTVAPLQSVSKALFHRHAHRAGIILLAVKQAGSDDFGIGDGVTPVVRALLIPSFVEILKKVLFARTAVVALQNLFDRFIKSGCGRNFSHTATNHFLGVLGGKSGGNHGTDKHFAVDTVFDVGDRSVPMCHFSRHAGIAGVEVAEEIASDLSADPLSVGILVLCRFGGQYIR